MISAARKIAFDALVRVESQGAYASDVLHRELHAKVSAADAALATELTLGVLRWRGLLDFLLQRSLKKPVARVDLPVALALRMGLYQLRFLQRIPARAAVNESVELIKRAHKASAASLVNAILRRASEEAALAPEQFLSGDLSLAARLSILHSHPQWMVERWLVRLGEASTIALLEADNRTPRLSIALHDLGQRDEVLSELESTGLQFENGQLLRSALAVKGGSVGQTRAFREGRISIQDEASQVVPRLLEVHAGDRVLDVCAAPGGKTPVLARAAGADALVLAADFYGHRLSAMRAQFARLGIKNILLAQLDATMDLPFRAKFQRILVDAPCSGTGTLARHPEIRWRLRPERLGEFHGLQVAILSKAAAVLAPGGRLVYSTCSLEQEENEAVVEGVVSNDPAVRRVSPSEAAQAIESHLAPGVTAESLLDDSGHFHTFPGWQQTDGFFAAILEKS